MLKDAYLHDKTDNVWSAKAAQQIYHSYANRLPEGANLRSVDCRTSLCQVEVRYRDEKDYHQFGLPNRICGREHRGKCSRRAVDLRSQPAPSVGTKLPAAGSTGSTAPAATAC